jgi:hypothetical protein
MRTLEEEIGKYKRRFEWKGGGWNVQEETGKSTRRLESKGGYVKV